MPADREADRQPEPHPRQRGRHLAERQERGDRDRGPALLRAQGRRLHGHRARALAGRPAPARAAQGASTITQQFVKNALSAQNNRSVFQKLREAALAYHLERKWSKEKILTQYLNTVYFGNGAYGIESAARTYFGDATTTPAQDVRAPHTQTRPGARDVDCPAEAALLAGMIASPSLTTRCRTRVARTHAAQPRAAAHARAEHDHRARSTTRRISQALPGRGRDRPAATSTPSSPTSRAG